MFKKLNIKFSNTLFNIRSCFLATRDVVQLYRYERSHMVVDLSLHCLIDYWQQSYNLYDC